MKKFEITEEQIKELFEFGSEENKQQLAVQFPEVLIKEETYSMGDRFIDCANEQYMLSMVDKQNMCLINLVSGNRFRDPVKVENCFEISVKEFKAIIGDYDFKKIYIKYKRCN